MSIELTHSPANSWRIPFDGNFGAAQLVHAFEHPGDKDDNEVKLEKIKQQLDDLQRPLYAGKQYSVLLIFQALDAAGKDGTIRSVFSALDPSGVQVSAFKAPTELETRHDMLWRTGLCLPPRGVIGIFNRSYYEEVLTVRVHPEFLNGQYPAGVPDLDQLWPARFEAIRAHERHLAQSGTLVLKLWLNVSLDEQRKRFLSRLKTPRKQWKFNGRDVDESHFRDAYDQAFIDMVNQTSRPWAPWYMIPANDKPAMRALVAEIVEQALQGLNPQFPAVKEKDREKFIAYEAQLTAE